MTSPGFEWSPSRTTRLIEHGGSGRPMLLAPGAGTDQLHPLVMTLAAALVGVGLRVWTFDYPFKAEGRRAPDRPQVLLECHRAVVDHLRQETGELPVLAGRSMGGRLSTMLAAVDPAIPAVAAYGYPLHPPGRPERLRVEHLGLVAAPMFFARGERDTFSRPDLFDRHVRSLAGATILDLPGEDHSLRKPGTAEAIAFATAAFLADL
jgi:uncharacterized protein